MDVVVYPIVISYDPKEVEYPYFVEIPAVNGFTEGTSLEDAIKMAEDYIGSLSLSGKPMPKSVYTLPKADNGDTVIVIEHNLDVIKVADYIIDLGPDGGINGGTIVATGTPEQVAKVKESYTGQWLKKYLEK